MGVPPPASGCGACSGFDLSDAKRTRFNSLRDAFTRELKEGARPITRTLVIGGVLQHWSRCGRVTVGSVVAARVFHTTLIDLWAIRTRAYYATASTPRCG